MRGVPGRWMLRLVSDQIVHIEIDVSCADDGFRGRVGDGVREPSAFRGWLGLLGALDAMTSTLRQDSPMPNAGTSGLTRSVNREGEPCS